MAVRFGDEVVNWWPVIRPQSSRALLELAIAIAISVLALVVVFVKVPHKPRSHIGAVVEFIAPDANPIGTVVYDSTIAWNLQGQFFLTVPYELAAGDYIACAAAGVTPWNSADYEEAVKKGYPQVSPNGMNQTPRQLKSRSAASYFPAQDASEGSLIGIVGPNPVYDNTAIAHVKGGSDYFPVSSKSCWRVATLPKGEPCYLSLAINDTWTVGGMADNTGTWYIEVHVFRLGGKPVRTKP